MLEFQNVTKQFDTVTAVKNISFKVDDGKVLGIIGRNGAGKSTIFRMILNLIEPTEGTITYNGKKIDEKVLDTFGYLPEEGSILPQFSVIDICEYYGSLKLMNQKETFENLNKWLNEFNIIEHLSTKVKKLSKGNRQKIQFIVSVLHNPNFIILDEPFSGLDPVSVEELERAILKLKSEGKTIIFSSHVMSHVENICDEILMINRGDSLLQGNLKEILSDYTINGNKVESLNDIFIDKVGDACE
ncbi:MAG: ATP-binding cassette domain-containing protein [Clostridia bacterium]|nr:ATP-binding cassette domain-containing protein [Clostridia bacterium]